MNLGLICVREIEPSMYDVETLEFEGTLPELLISMLDLFNKEDFGIVYTVEDWQSLEFIDAVEKIRETNIEEIYDEEGYKRVFGRLSFVEFRKYPLTKEPTFQMTAKWSYHVDDQMVIPLLDLPLVMRCAKKPKFDPGAKYIDDLLVIIDAKRLMTQRDLSVRITAVIAVVISFIKGKLHVTSKTLQINLSFLDYMLEKMDLRTFYAVLALAVLQSDFLDNLSEVFKEECIEHTKKKYREFVDKLLPII